MIVRTRSGRNLEFRSEWGLESRIPAPGSGLLSAAGEPVTSERAYGVPAVSNVIRSPAEIIASLPFMVYRQGDIRERAPGSWQYGLLHDRPSGECDSFEFFYDLALSLEATQNAFLQKAAQGGRVWELYVLDPQRVVVRRDRDTGEKLFDVWIGPTASDVRKGLTKADILHIRGFSPRPGAVAGVSLIHQHRDPIGAAIAMQGFEGDYFRNSALTPLVFQLGPSGTKQQAEALLDAWDRQHQGRGNQFRTGAVWGDTTLQPVPLSLQDALFAEAKQLSIADACRIWRWPKELLEISENQTSPPDENAWTSRFLKFYLLPRLRRIERADIVTRYRAYKDARQGSWITANEIRRPENLPDIEGGDEILITPVGGAPNPPPSGARAGDYNALERNGHAELILPDLSRSE